MPIYTIRTICEHEAAKLGRRVNCLTDCEALELAQRMASAGLSLEVWRGDELLGSAIAGQVMATSEKMVTKGRNGLPLGARSC